jgi:type IV fimbrial biogenesis protein FimT
MHSELTSAPVTGNPDTRARRDPGGFTLLELMIVVAIGAIMAALAAPAMRDTYTNNHVKIVAADLAQDMAFARANAIAYSKNVIIQPNTAGTWTSGWQVYVDSDTSGTFTAGDITLKSATPTSGTLLICTNAFAANVIFRPDGTVGNAGLPANPGITVSDTEGQANVQHFMIHTLYIGSSGRVTNVLQNPGNVPAPTSTGVGGSGGGACP